MIFVFISQKKLILIQVLKAQKSPNGRLQRDFAKVSPMRRCSICNGFLKKLTLELGR